MVASTPTSCQRAPNGRSDNAQACITPEKRALALKHRPTKGQHRNLYPFLFLFCLACFGVFLCGCALECQPDPGPFESNCPDNDDVFCNGTAFCDVGLVMLGITQCAQGQENPCIYTEVPVCNEELDACFPCQSDSECDDHVACTIDECDSSGCSMRLQSDLCPEGLVCGGNGCIDAECVLDSDCSAPKPYCLNNHCQVCSNFPPPLGLGCPSETPWCDCVEPSSCEVRACYECLFDDNCPPGENCVDHHCQ